MGAPGAAAAAATAAGGGTPAAAQSIPLCRHLEYGGSRKVLLTRADRIFEVKEGEMLEQGFRVQAVTPQAVTLLYEPLDAPVTVALVFQEAPAQAALPEAAAGRTAPPPTPTQPIAQPVPQAVPHAPAPAPSSPSPFPPGSPPSPPGIVPGGATAR